MPHGHCFLWTPDLLWLYVASDSVIAIAYYSIPLGLWYFAQRRQDLPFKWIFIMFGVFVLACGTTHILAIWNIWQPVYWLDAGIKAVTALVSIITAILLWPLIPKALAIPTQKQLQDANRALEQEVVQRSQAETQLRSSATKLDSANKELEAFCYSVSHDLRAPLRHVDGFVGLLKKHGYSALDAKAQRYIDVIAESARKMSGLIDDLLAFSRMGRAELTRKPVNMEKMVRDVIQEVERGADGRTVNWHIGALPEPDADPAMLRLVLTNLLCNALKFTGKREEPKIEIGAMISAATETVFYVRDNGAGFDMKYVDKLFGVFQRLHHAEDFEGTGIGLANVQRIIHRHGGRVWAEGKIDGGATFYFSLPTSTTKG